MTPATTSLKPEISSSFDWEKIRADFPILQLKIDGKPLIYLDNAASSQMPQQVIDRLVRYQTTQHANINRAVHYLSEVATMEYHNARCKLQQFINAREDREVIFTSGTTDSINLVMHGYGRKFIKAGDEIILTTLEHHSNIVPWQMLAQEKGAKIRVVPINDKGELEVDEYEKLFNERTKFVGLIHVSNALGTVNPIKRMIDFAHRHGVLGVRSDAIAAPTAVGAHLSLRVLSRGALVALEREETTSLVVCDQTRAAPAAQGRERREHQERARPHASATLGILVHVHVAAVIVDVPHELHQVIELGVVDRPVGARVLEAVVQRAEREEADARPDRVEAHELGVVLGSARVPGCLGVERGADELELRLLTDAHEASAREREDPEPAAAEHEPDAGRHAAAEEPGIGGGRGLGHVGFLSSGAVGRATMMTQPSRPADSARGRASSLSYQRDEGRLVAPRRLTHRRGRCAARE